MKYAFVLALGAPVLAQNYTQSASQSCIDVVTVTTWEYITTCPCSTTSTTLATNTVSNTLTLSTSSTTSGTTSSGSSASLSGTNIGSNTNDGPTLLNPTSTTTSGSTLTTTSGAVGSTTTSSSGSVGTDTTTIAPPPSTTGPATTTTTSTTSAVSVSVPVPTPTVPAAGTRQLISLSAPELVSPVQGTDYEYRALYAHNLHRVNNTVPLLSWNSQMAQWAAELAATCVYGHSRAQGDGNYGQNIGAGFLPNQVPAMITNNMYNNEINNYPGPYGSDNLNGGFNEQSFLGWGHYSQLVWRDTLSVGCATQYCPNGLANTGSNTPPYFTVCNYFPSGNFVGQWSKVGTPSGGGTVEFTP